MPSPNSHTMEPLTLFFDGIDNASPAGIARETFTKDPQFEPKIIDIFRQYLRTEGGLCLSDTAKAIIELLPDPPEPRGWSHELIRFWELCIETAEQIPHYHVCQLKLARLLMVLRTSPKTRYIARGVSSSSIIIFIESC